MAEASAVPLPDHEDAITRNLVRVAGWAVMLLAGTIGSDTWRRLSRLYLGEQQ